MRQIKFRGKDAVTGNWVYGYFLRFDGLNYIYPFTNNLYEKAIKIIVGTEGQYTGLKDKNGKAIYDGDILQFKEKEGFGNGVVEYRYCSFYAKYLNGLAEGGFDLMKHKWKIIGNIYENPELIKS